ncbi:MAG: bifunctional 4-hydroxy-2-oxoglutarate aldolase/2-dehydro-3-deoxy-phosphogluconate aldolase [Oscillospiraceae bacterium]|nr:bifunctional 4-hydroxy-2-oxoglutarate aldolase/2-dehydro-3-deoxy-phosphogluconate aldolase [Oscillospiraceae bacterium]
MTKEAIIQSLKSNGLVAVLRGDSPEQAAALAGRCIEAGIRCVEITFSIPFAHRAIESLAAKYGGAITLGAGTVLDAETARTAILSGAEFVVSPAVSAQVIQVCNRYRKVSMPGVMTATEAVAALEQGADFLKLFPGETLGPGFLKALRGPLPFAEFAPSGGVELGNIKDWFAAGASFVGVGGNLTRGDISANARAYLEAVKAARE